jgi:hypothetical protein
MTQALTTIGFVLGPSLLGLAGLALRLRWHAVRDQRRQDTLRALTAHLTSTDVVVEIRDVRDDGSHLEIRTTPALDPYRRPR